MVVGLQEQLILNVSGEVYIFCMHGFVTQAGTTDGCFGANPPDEYMCNNFQLQLQLCVLSRPYWFGFCAAVTSRHQLQYSLLTLPSCNPAGP